MMSPKSYLPFVLSFKKSLGIDFTKSDISSPNDISLAFPVDKVITSVPDPCNMLLMRALRVKTHVTLIQRNIVAQEWMNNFSICH
jgi:hypothetical protein